MSEKTKNDGGPAFPLQSIGPEFEHGYCGMSLRAWLAGRALQGLITNGKIPENKDRVCQAAVEYADSMIWRLSL